MAHVGQRAVVVVAVALIVVLLMGVLAIAIIKLAGLKPEQYPFALLGVMMAAFIPAYATILKHYARYNRQLQKWQTESHDEPTRTHVESLIRIGIGRPGRPLEPLADWLLSKRRFGEVIRIHFGAADECGPPLTEHFEPLLLKEGDPTFATVESMNMDVEVSGLLAIKRKFHEFLSRGENTLIFISICLMCSGYSIVGGGTKGILVMIVAGVFGMICFCSSRAGQWLLVPGGLLIRSQPWFSDRSQLELLTPNEAVLVFYIRRDVTWVLVAGSNRRFRKCVTRREADLLVRAWCSPLSPPSIELLTDLQG